ncbi:MAG: MlaD family protein [Solirubrobacteraceae bacterium]
MPAFSASSVRRIVPVAIAVVAVVLFAGSRYGVLFGRLGSYPHYIQMVVPSAFEVIPGQRMVAGGVTVGQITAADVTRQGQAHLVMGVDDSAWPLPTDSILTLRMGGTIKFTDRFISIDKGHAQTYFKSWAYLPAKQFIVPVEYASLFDIFDSRARADMQSFFGNAAPTFSQAAPNFRKALNVASPALVQGAAVFSDIGYNQQALSTLIRSTAQLSDAVAASNPGVRTLLGAGASTFASFAAESGRLQQAISSSSTALRNSSHLATHVSVTLMHTATLADRLSPGVTQLTALAAPLDATLRELVNVEPTAVDTLTTVTRGAPSIASLLTSARTTLMPELKPVAAQAATQLNCIRPYTPDFISFIQGWAGYESAGLNRPHVHLFHVEAGVWPFPNSLGMNTQQLTKIFPQVGISFPTPPGEAWNQPWYQPQCGVTPKYQTAAADTEAGTYDSNGSKIVPYPSH